jgi:hypothetical protein
MGGIMKTSFPATPGAGIALGVVAFSFLAGSVLWASPAADEIGTLIDAYADAPREAGLKPDETVKSLEKVIQAHPSDPAVLDALEWMFRYGRQSSGSDFPLDKAFYERLEEYHLDDPKLTDIIVALHGYSGEDLQAFLKVASGKSKVEEVRGFALYTLADTLKFDDNAAAEFEATLAELVEKHEQLAYNGRDLMPKARSQLFASRNLAVGKHAPDIEGEDIDGVRFNLSEYRGKITYIVFWGDW